MPLALVAGAIAALGHPPFGMPWIALGGLMLGMGQILRAADKAQGFWTGWAVGLGYFAVTLHWIVEPFLVDFERHGWMAPFALVFLSGGLAILWGGAGWIMAAVGGREANRALTLAVAWTGMEALRAVLFTGFPWALVGTIWLDTPIAQVAAYIGPHGLTLLTLCCLAALHAITPRSALAAIAALIVPLVIALGIGAARGPAPEITADAPTLRLIQPNAAQHLKWEPDMIPVFFARQRALTAEGEPADLVIWPETAIPFPLGRAAEALRLIHTDARNAPVIVGANRFTPAGPTNALAVIGEGGEVSGLYDKSHLVPFGEYVPFGDLAAKAGISGLAAREGGGYTSGPGPQLLDLGPLGKALPLICYEAIFPQFGRALTLEADWMVQITNDAWFGEFAGPQQHLAQARMRAIERGLPLIRVANTGISAVIDANGRILDALPLGVSGALNHPLPPRRDPTLYARTGDWPVLALLAILGLWAWRGRNRPIPG